MPKVAVVTDSTACLPKRLAQEHGIRVVPLNFVFGDVSYEDDPDLDMSEFYRRLGDAKDTPTTAPSSPGTYLEVFKELSQNSDSILCVTVTSRISGMFESARVAKEMALDHLPGTEVRVMDSGTATMAQGFVALAAARVANRGESLDAVCKAAEDVKSRVDLVAMVDTLRYLAKSGRFPKAAAWATSLIGLKPILTLRDGHIKLLSAARSSRGGMVKMLKMMKQRTKRGHSAHISVIHANVPNRADEFAERVRHQNGCTELFVSHFTPVMGIYTGPGVLGLVFYTEG